MDVFKMKLNKSLLNNLNEAAVLYFKENKLKSDIQYYKDERKDLDKDSDLAFELKGLIKSLETQLSQTETSFMKVVSKLEKQLSKFDETVWNAHLDEVIKEHGKNNGLEDLLNYDSF